MFWKPKGEWKTNAEWRPMDRQTLLPYTRTSETSENLHRDSHLNRPQQAKWHSIWTQSCTNFFYQTTLEESFFPRWKATAQGSTAYFSIYLHPTANFNTMPVSVAEGERCFSKLKPIRVASKTIWTNTIPIRIKAMVIEMVHLASGDSRSSKGNFLVSLNSDGIGAIDGIARWDWANVNCVGQWSTRWTFAALPYNPRFHYSITL